MSVNYKGSFINKLYTAVDNNPDMTIGEVLFSFLHKSGLKGKHFFYASDIEIYNALESFIKIGVETEEPLTINEFEFWVDGKKFSTEK